MKAPDISNKSNIFKSLITPLLTLAGLIVALFGGVILHDQTRPVKGGVMVKKVTPTILATPIQSIPIKSTPTAMPSPTTMLTEVIVSEQIIVPAKTVGITASELFEIYWQRWQRWQGWDNDYELCLQKWKQYESDIIKTFALSTSLEEKVHFFDPGMSELSDLERMDQYEIFSEKKLFVRMKGANDVAQKLIDSIEEYNRNLEQMTFVEALRAIQQSDSEIVLLGNGLSEKTHKHPMEYYFGCWRIGQAWDIWKINAVREVYLKYEKWELLADFHRRSMPNWDLEVYYLRKCGAEGRAEIARQSTKRVWRSFMSIGPDFYWPWEEN